MAMFSVSLSNTPLNTSNDLMTIIPAAGHPIQIIEISIAGMGTASAANEIAVQRSSGGTTGGAAITPSPIGKFSVAGTAPTSNTVVDTTWSVQPSLTANTKVLALGVNANGGIYRWVARPGEEIVVANADQLSIRPAVGSSNISIHVIFLEDCF